MKSTTKILLAVLAAIVCAPAQADEAEKVRRGGESLVENWHVGPFFEYRKSEPGGASFWALRPLYSQIRDKATDTSVTDLVWPLYTKHDHAEAMWWNALLFMHGDARKADGSRSFHVYPLFYTGVDRRGTDYWGIFPFYGTHPHFALVDDLTFVCWPFWHTYEVKGVRSRAVCWPFVTWRDEPRKGLGIWPFYGYARLRESDHKYLLWPLVTWARYDEDRDTSGAGYSWWMLPFYGEVRRARESQTMFLPPFFSYAETDKARRLRLPWPLVDLEKTPTRDRLSLWPFWEQVRGYSYASLSKGRKVEEMTWRAGWKLVENVNLKSDRTEEYRFNLFPFFTYEKRTGKLSEPDTYVRVWPFWSKETKNGRTRHRALELMPFRHSEAIERNWAPFWSLYEVDERADGRTRCSLLFNFISFQ